MPGPGRASSCGLWEALEKLSAGGVVRSVALHQGHSGLTALVGQGRGLDKAEA